MSTASGLVLIAAGLGVGVYALSGPQGAFSAPEEAPAPVAGAAIPAAPPATAIAARPTPPSVPTEQVAPASAPKAAIVPPKPAPAARPASAPATPVVALPHRPAEPAAPPPSFKVAALPGDRVGLARALQRELKRAGCYEGEITGLWTPSSRRAMKAFTDRVNASLPIDDPDYILLTLVQGHQGTVCGTPCPSGQVFAEGRCVPQALTAHARKAPSESATGWPSPTLTASIAPPPSEGRMSLAGPKPETTPPTAGESAERTAAAPAPTAEPPRRKRHRAARGPLPPAAIYRHGPPRYVMTRAPYDTPWARGFYRRIENP